MTERDQAEIEAEGLLSSIVAEHPLEQIFDEDARYHWPTRWKALIPVVARALRKRDEQISLPQKYEIENGVCLAELESLKSQLAAAKQEIERLKSDLFMEQEARKELQREREL